MVVARGVDLDRHLMGLISEATNRFGPRYRPELEIAPVIIRDGEYAQTHIIGNQITVSVSPKVNEHFQFSTYQLSHEAVHCVLATGNPETLFFEEGLALWFSQRHQGLRPKFRKRADLRLHDEFRAPYDLFMKINPTDQQIREIRALCPNIDDLTPELVREVLMIPEPDVMMLCTRMNKKRAFEAF